MCHIDSYSSTAKHNCFRLRFFHTYTRIYRIRFLFSSAASLFVFRLHSIKAHSYVYEQNTTRIAHIRGECVQCRIFTWHMANRSHEKRSLMGARLDYDDQPFYICIVLAAAGPRRLAGASLPLRHLVVYECVWNCGLAFV